MGTDTNVIAVGFSNGVFSLYKMPEFEIIESLNIFRNRITSSVFNSSGNWIALGCADSGHLLVRDWRLKVNVIKQQGHCYDVNSVAYSPDGVYIATGATDGTIMIWDTSTNRSLVTIHEHTKPVTNVVFVPPLGKLVLASSDDGTIRAYDLVRFKFIRTLTSPTNVQLHCLVIDSAGDLIFASPTNSSDILVWSLRLGNIIDKLIGHDSPVSCMAFSTESLYLSDISNFEYRALLTSGSWDST